MDSSSTTSSSTSTSSLCLVTCDNNNVPGYDLFSNLLPEAFTTVLSFLVRTGPYLSDNSNIDNHHQDDDDDLNLALCCKSLHRLVEMNICTARLGNTVTRHVDANIHKIRQGMQKITGGGRDRMPNRLLARCLQLGYPIECHQHPTIGVQFPERWMPDLRTTTLSDGYVAFQGFHNGRPCLQVFDSNHPNFDLVCQTNPGRHDYFDAQLWNYNNYIVSYTEGVNRWDPEMACWKWDPIRKSLQLEFRTKPTFMTFDPNHGTFYEHYAETMTIHTYHVQRPERKVIKSLATTSMPNPR